MIEDSEQAKAELEEKFAQQAKISTIFTLFSVDFAIGSTFSGP